MSNETSRETIQNLIYRLLTHDPRARFILKSMSETHAPLCLRVMVSHEAFYFVLHISKYVDGLTQLLFIRSMLASRESNAEKRLIIHNLRIVYSGGFSF